VIKDSDIFPLLEDALSIAKAAERLSDVSRHMGGIDRDFDEEGNKNALDNLRDSQPIALEQIKILENYAVLLRCKCAALQALAEQQGCDLSASEFLAMATLPASEKPDFN